METFMPSEIARLVVGYLEEQKCDEAAKFFLETSPLLQECRMVQASGKTFRRLVREMTLIDVFDKYCSIVSFIQERLNKIADSDQVKHCGDFLEQLRFLIDGSRSQRFVVNINVPSQNSATTTGGSPIISSSIRKRQRSGSDRDRDRCKRFAKLQSLTPEKQNNSENIHCDKVEATPAESLPGHIDLTKSNSDERSAVKQKIKENHVIQDECNDYDCKFYMPGSSTEQPENIRDLQKNQEKTNNSEESNKCVNFSTTPLKCSMSTDTEDLLKIYQNTQASTWGQILDYEEIMNNEPLENLSLLGQGLLHCKEIQEQIAENINKSGLLPTDANYKDEALIANSSGFNTSGIFKSIVEETMVTASFQQFVGSVLKITDSNSNTNTDGKNKLELNQNEQLQNLTDIFSMENRIDNNKIVDSTDNNNELRNLLTNQRSKVTNDIKEVNEEGINISDLNDQNNAAIQSIINANSANSELIQEKSSSLEQEINESSMIKTNDADCKNINDNSAGKNISEELETSIEIIDVPAVDDAPAPPVVSTKPRITSMKILPKGSRFSKRKEKRPVKKPVVNIPIISDSTDTMITSTLVVCSKDDPGSFLGVPPSYTNIINPHYLSITPKSIQFKQEPVYFKHVNVPQKVPGSIKKNFNILPNPSGTIPLPLTHPVTISLPSVELPLTTPVITISEENITPSEYSIPKSLPNIDIIQEENYKSTENVNNLIENTNIDVKIEIPKIITPTTSTKETTTINNIDPICNLEHITLYGNETSAAEFLTSNEIETLNVDASMTFSLSGLSPFLKMNRVVEKKSETKSNPQDILPSVSTIIDNEKKTELITKRTPKSIIKSRSKNHRLSLSTPRRRHSHVRALDFGTPTKSNSASKSSSSVNKISPTSRNRSNCRTSLFKSPPFINSSQKLKSPKNNSTNYKIPIATRSPAPKLMGGWEKFNGMDMILGKVSPNDNFNSTPIENIETKPPTIFKSWDTELRKMANPEETISTEAKNKKPKAPRKIKKVKEIVKKNNKKRGSRKTPAKKSDDNKLIETQSKEQSSKEILCETISDKDLSDLPIDSLNKEQSPKDSIKKNESLNDSKNFFPSDKDLSFTLDDSELCKSNSKIQTPNIPIGNNQEMKSEKKSGEIVKKYAKVVTIPRSETQQNVEFMSKTSPNYREKIIMQLETPRKLVENLKNDIPPTPRFLSPNSSSITPFTKVSRNEDSSKIPDLFPTPDFAPTPGNKLTPNLASENTKDAIKKGEFNSCSPYYQPSSEIDDKMKKEQSKNITKVEEFQVIKVNLTREEAAKEELTISSSLNEIIQDEEEKEKEKLPVIYDMEVEKNLHDSDSESTGSDSNTSSSSYSSMSSSSSSSASDDSSDTSLSDNNSPTKKINNLPTKSCSNSSGSSSFHIVYEPEIPKETEIATKINNPPVNAIITNNEIERKEFAIPKFDIEKSSIKEVSPQKMFSVTNINENDDQETPAKNELLIEATISETPSSSKAGSDITTNLSTKITEIMTSEQKLCKVPLKPVPPVKSLETKRVANILKHTNKSGLNLQTIDYLKPENLALKGERLKKGFCEASLVQVKKKGKTANNNQNKRNRRPIGRNLQTNARKIIPNYQINTNISIQEKKENEIIEQNLLNENSILEKSTEKKKNIPKNEKKETSNEEIIKLLPPKTTKTPKKGRTPKKGKTPKKVKPPKKTSSKKNSPENLIEELDKNKIQDIENKIDNNDKTEIETGDQILDDKVKEIITTLGDEKLSLKAKVDLVKRDLFSDDEIVDQRRTRSKSRQASDTNKSDDTNDSILEQLLSLEKSSKEDLPCVLQSLDLVPTTNTKNDNSFYNTSQTELRHGEYHFIYDDTIIMEKKRRRKYSISELEIDLDNGEERHIILAATKMEEIFSLLPKKPKKGGGSNAAGKKSPSKNNNNKKLLNILEKYEKPLASSSPIMKAVQSSGKNVNFTKNEEIARVDIDKNEKGKLVEKEKPKAKSRKRKMLTAEEPDHTKAKVVVPENLALLHHPGKEDKLLSFLHGP